MNDTEITEAIYLSDVRNAIPLTPLDDLNFARQYISRNPHLIKDYPSLEEALKLLKRVIEHEEADRASRNARQTL